MVFDFNHAEQADCTNLQLRALISEIEGIEDVKEESVDETNEQQRNIQKYKNR
jgi:hypothetical protein